MTLKELKEGWQDTPDHHRQVHDTLIELARGSYLEEHRRWCREHVFGFGEDSFPYMWKLLVDEMPQQFTFCEIGCFKFQTVTLIKLIANEQHKTVNRICISPMDGSGGLWEEDYFAHCRTIHEHFGIPQDYRLLHGSSTDPKVIEYAGKYQFDLLYIDGSHEYGDVLSDLRSYAPLVKAGGFLVIDDACCEMKMWWGAFQGIESVNAALADWGAEGFEFVCNVVHLRVMRRVK